jgi:hypothetical protein
MKTLLICLMIALNAQANTPLITPDSCPDVHFQVKIDSLQQTALLSWQNNAEMPAVLEIKEINGGMTLKMFLEAQPAGTAVKEVSLSAFSAGKYLVTLETGHTVARQEIVLNQAPLVVTSAQ